MTFNRLAIALLFIAIAAAACLMPAQNDTFWHLRAGFEAWQGGTLLYRDTSLTRLTAITGRTTSG